MNAQFFVTGKTKQRKCSHQSIWLESDVVIHQQNMSRPAFVSQLDDPARKPTRAAKVRVLHHRDRCIWCSVKLNVSSVVYNQYAQLAAQCFNCVFKLKNFCHCGFDVFLAIERCNRQRKSDLARNWRGCGPLAAHHSYVTLFSTNTNKKSAIFMSSKLWNFENCLAVLGNAS